MHIFHKWIFIEKIKSEKFIEPKCGPFDPRSDEDRTHSTKVKEKYVCCDCGKIKIQDEPDYGYYWGEWI